MAVTDDTKTDVLHSAAKRVKEWLEDNPAPAMPEYVSTIDGQILRLDPSGSFYMGISGAGDAREARVTVQRLNEAARYEHALRVLGLIEDPPAEDD